ncbi:MAG: hypothetical protein V4545_02140 [Pseudomonadota bacterium]
MKSKSLIGLAAALLLTTGVVQAGDDKAQNIINQNLSKRPYQEAPAESTANKADNWEAATLVKDEAVERKSGPNSYQQLNIRMLGKRPYMDKATD